MPHLFGSYILPQQTRPESRGFACANSQIWFIRREHQLPLSKSIHSAAFLDNATLLYFGRVADCAHAVCHWASVRAAI